MCVCVCVCEVGGGGGQAGAFVLVGKDSFHRVKVLVIVSHVPSFTPHFS